MRFVTWFEINFENEYGNIDSYYGSAGKSYIKWAAKMATSLDTGVPWVICQQGDAPDPIVSFMFWYVNVNCFLVFGLLGCLSSKKDINLSMLSAFILLDFYFNCLQINTCNGFYCDQFTPNSNTKPKMWTENWTAWLAT